MADIFLSYARLDREKAELVKTALEETLGLSVFFDVDGLDGGDVFPDVLDREVKTAGAVVSLWSPHALSRPWVKQECSVGLKRGCLIPVAIEPLGDLDVPVAFEGRQQVDFTGFDGRTDTKEWQQLVRALARTLKRPDMVKAAAPAARAAEAARATPRGPRPKRTWRALGGGVLLVCAVVLTGLLLAERLLPEGSGAENGPVSGPVAEADGAGEAPPSGGLTQVEPWFECGDLTSLIYFEFDQTRLTPEATTILERALHDTFACTVRSVRVEAHDDLLNSSNYAESVGQRRADTVRDFLISAGIDGSAIESLSFGASRPLVAGLATPANRRVEVFFDLEPQWRRIDGYQRRSGGRRIIDFEDGPA